MRQKLFLILFFAFFSFGITQAVGEDIRVWPIYYRNTDAVSKEIRQEVFWPLYSRYSTTKYQVHKILSFQQDYPTQYSGQLYFLWPLTGFRWGEDIHDLWIFPLLWSASEKDRGHLSCFPLWLCWWRKNQLNLNFALLLHNSWKADGQAHYLFPVFWSCWTETQHRKQYSHGIFPLFRIAMRQDTPVKQEAEGRSYDSFYLFPYWQGSRGQDAAPAQQAYLRKWQGVFPVFYNTRGRRVSGKNKERSDEIWDQQSCWLFPYWQKTESHVPSENPPCTRAGLEQLKGQDFQLDSRRRLLPPFYWHEQKCNYHSKSRELSGEREQFWLFPWWMSYRWDSSGHSLSRWLFPAQWGESSEKDSKGLTQVKSWQAFWPLYRSRRESEQTAAGEIRLDSKALWLFPWYSSAFEGANASGGSWFFLLGGAGKSTQQAQQSSAEQGFRYVVPLYFQSWMRQSAGDATLCAENKLWAFPYWRCRSQEKEQDFLPPFYLSDRQHHRNEFLSVGGLYNRREKQASLRRKQCHEKERQDMLPGDWRGKWSREDLFWQHLLPFWYRSFDAEKEMQAIFPLYSFSQGCKRNYERQETLQLPWLLGSSSTVKRADAYQQKTQSYALSLYRRSQTEWPDEKKNTLRASSLRIWPLFAYFSNAGQNFDCWSTLPPFSYRSRGSIFAENNRSLSLPWHWLPLYHWEVKQDTPIKGRPIRKNWFFPFYSYENNEKTDTQRLSIFWFLYQQEQFRDEKKVWGMGGGLSNYYERDSNGFVERSVLYRLYRFRQRSWFAERELMPFYAAAEYVNSDWHWSILGGLLGAGKSAETSWVKFLYIPFRKREPPVAAEQLEAERLQRAPLHLDYALKYAEAGRFDRAAMEFMLAEGAFESDYDLLLVAGNAYARADAERFAEYFRKDLPSSLSRLAGKGERYRRGRAKQELLGQALEFYEKALQVRGASSDLLCRMALCHLQRHDEQAALLKLKQRDEQFPSFAAAVDYFRILDKMGIETGQAAAGIPPLAELLERMLARFPEHPLFYLYKARSMGDDKEAKIACYEKAALMQPVEEELLPLPVTWELPCPVINHQGDFPSAAKFSGFAAEWAIVRLNERYAIERQEKRLTQELAQEFKERVLRLYPLQKYARDNFELLKKYHGEFGSDIGLRQELLGLQDSIPGGTENKSLLQSVQRSLLEVELRLSQLCLWKVRRIDAAATPEQREVRLLNKSADGYIDLDAFFGGIDDCEVEAQCSITAPAETPLQLWLGFDRELRVELNGKTLFGPARQKIARRDAVMVPITLQAGPNHLTLYIRDDRLSFGFFARLSDPDGQPSGSWRWQKPCIQP
ncbi:MAG: hypothetical protein WCT05_07490 [Lentisphaeria bacterium]